MNFPFDGWDFIKFVRRLLRLSHSLLTWFSILDFLLQPLTLNVRGDGVESVWPLSDVDPVNRGLKGQVVG